MPMASAQSEHQGRFAARTFTLFQALTAALLCCLLVGVMSPSASAHPRQEAETEISFNETTGLTEIVHRFRVRDSEIAIQRLYGESLNIFSDAEAQGLFGDYVSQRFSISRNGQPVDLTLVGGEIEDGYIWIYETAPACPEDGIYVVRDSPLLDTHRDQTNILNIRLYDEVQSSIFPRSTPWATFRLDGESVY